MRGGGGGGWWQECGQEERAKRAAARARKLADAPAFKQRDTQQRRMTSTQTSKIYNQWIGRSVKSFVEHCHVSSTFSSARRYSVTPSFRREVRAALVRPALSSHCLSRSLSVSVVCVRVVGSVAPLFPPLLALRLATRAEVAAGSAAGGGTIASDSDSDSPRGGRYDTRRDIEAHRVVGHRATSKVAAAWPALGATRLIDWLVAEAGDVASAGY